MSKHQSANDANMGDPNLGALQYLQDNWKPSDIASALHICKVEIVTGGNVGVEADIPMGAEIIDIVVNCTRSNGSGSMTVKTNALSPVTISNAMAAVTADVVARAGTIDTTYSTVGADGIAVFANAAADAANVYIYYMI